LEDYFCEKTYCGDGKKGGGGVGIGGGQGSWQEWGAEKKSKPSGGREKQGVP